MISSSESLFLVIATAFPTSSNMVSDQACLHHGCFIDRFSARETLVLDRDDFLKIGVGEWREETEFRWGWLWLVNLQGCNKMQPIMAPYSETTGHSGSTFHISIL